MQAEYSITLIQALRIVFMIYGCQWVLWICAKKKPKTASNSSASGTASPNPSMVIKSGMRAPQPESAVPPKSETPDKKEEKKEEEQKKDDQKSEDKKAEKKDDKVAQSMKPFPKFVMPTESVKKRKEKENEEDKKKKIKEGFYQENSGEDDTLEKVKSLEVEKSDKTKRSQRNKK